MKLILSLNLLIASTLFAGHIVGTGGFGVECEDGRVEIYDFHRMDETYSYLKGERFDVLVNERLEKITELDPKFGAELTKRWANFFERVKWVDEELEFTYDIVKDRGMALAAAEGCEFVQLIERRNANYKINTKLFYGLNEVHKAGIVMHELLYELSQDKNYSAYLPQVIRMNRYVWYESTMRRKSPRFFRWIRKETKFL